MTGGVDLGDLAAVGLGVVVVMLAALLVGVLRRPSGRLEAELGHLAGSLNAALAEFARVGGSVGDLGRVQEELRAQVAELRSRVEATGSNLGEKTLQAQMALQREIAEAQKLVQEVRAELSERKIRDEEVRKAVRHLETVLAGAPGKGAAGENILDEAFRSFPASMVERDFRVRGKVVEYALVVGTGDRRLPIDSKWPATDALEKLAAETDPDARQRAVRELRQVVSQKVKEVAQYLDPLATTDIAIAAIPDAVYPYCGGIAYDAYSKGVIIMPYGMTVPYVLNLYNLYLKYSRTVDLESLDHHLAGIERAVGSLEDILEHRIHKGATMVGNAYADVKHIAEQIRLTLNYIRALPAVAERAALPGDEAEETGPGSL